MQILVVADVTCPRCGHGEAHPTRPDRILIRAYKVHDGISWSSQCLVCAGLYDAALNETPANFDRAKGWFRN